MHETQEQTGHPPQLFMERKLERADTLISVGTRTHARTGESALCSQEAGVKPRSAGRDPLHTRSESVLRLETSGLLFVQATPVQTLGKGDPTCEPLGANVQLRWPRPRTQWLCSTSRVPGREPVSEPSSRGLLQSRSVHARGRLPPAQPLLTPRGIFHSRVRARPPAALGTQKTGESQKGQGLCRSLLIQSGSSGAGCRAMLSWSRHRL